MTRSPRPADPQNSYSRRTYGTASLEQLWIGPDSDSLSTFNRRWGINSNHERLVALPQPCIDVQRPLVWFPHWCLHFCDRISIRRFPTDGAMIRYIYNTCNKLFLYCIVHHSRGIKCHVVQYRWGMHLLATPGASLMLVLDHDDWRGLSF